MSETVVSVLKPADEGRTLDAGSSRVLNLDDDRERPVLLGGREFLIRPQRCAILQQVAMAIGRAQDAAAKLVQQGVRGDLIEEVTGRLADALAATELQRAHEIIESTLTDLAKEQGGEEFSMERFSKAAFQNFEEQLPVIALILGFDSKHAEYPEVLAHLQEHLTFDRGQRIFEVWWEVNRVDDFFAYAGNVLMTARPNRNGDGAAST